MRTPARFILFALSLIGFAGSLIGAAYKFGVVLYILAEVTK